MGAYQKQCSCITQTVIIYFMAVLTSNYVWTRNAIKTKNDRVEVPWGRDYCRFLPH